jgi:putative phage-type endonuclease
MYADMTYSTRDEWLAARRSGIGGSDAAAVLGLSRWLSPLDVYLAKIGEGGDPEDTPAMYWGRRLERVILEAYVEQTGVAVDAPTGVYRMLRSTERPWQLYSPDGIADDRLIEIKTTRTSEGWGEPGTDDVPDDYAIQVQHGMAVTGLQRCDVAVLIGGSDFRVYTVERDDKLIADLIAAEAAFWARVERRDPPPPRTYTEAQRLWGRASPPRVPVYATDEAEAAYRELLSVRDQLAELERRKEELQAILCAEMADRGDTLIGASGQPIATWTVVKPRESFDARTFATDHPDLHAAYLRVGQPTRRFNLKTTKETA